MSIASDDPATLVTTCTLDCPDACSLQVTISGVGDDRRIESIDAADGNPLTQGWICAKVKRHAQRVYAPERVLTPLVRTGPKGSGEFRPATWDEALGLVADRISGAIDAAGPDAVVAFTYNSSSGRIEGESMTEALFAALGATAVAPTICAATVAAAWDSVYGEMASADPLDVIDAQLVVIWGANPTVSNSHFAPLVQQAVRSGAKLVVIDPRRTAVASRADLHLAVRPGTDVVLAMAIANEWVRTGRVDRAFIDRHTVGVDEFLAAASDWSLEAAGVVCGLEPEAIATLAAWWAETRPTMLRVGWGQERSANGGAACRAILALPVLIGAFGQRGGGVIGATRTDAVDPLRRWPAFAALDRRSVNLHEVGRWLAPDAGDPCRVLVVQGANPVLMCPDQNAVIAGFSRPDVFTVVHDQVLTDTARYADVVLPATTAFEVDDVVTGYGTYSVNPVHAVIAPVGQSRSNDQFGTALAGRLGFDWPSTTSAQAVAAALGEDLAVGAAAAATQQFVDTFPDGGRARLVDPVHGVPHYLVPAASAYPLVLITPASPKLINSMFGEFQSPDPVVLLHPDDAVARGLSAGEPVRVFNDQGTLVVDLEVSDEVRPGVVVMSKGIWLNRHPAGRGVNLLTTGASDALADGACFNDTMVEVGPV